MKVAILGASDRPERYANKAMKSLEANGHETYLVNPSLNRVDERPVYDKLDDVNEDIHTLAMYVNPRISAGLAQDIVRLRPKRVIFNPGSENRELYPLLAENDIKVEEACVLVLLNTGAF